MSLRTRGLVVMTVVISVFVVLMVILASLFADVEAKGRTVTERLQPASNEVSQLLVANSDMERGVLGYLIASDPAFLSPYVVGRAQGDESIAKLTNLLSGTELSPLLDIAVAARDQWISGIAEPNIALVDADKRPQALMSVTDGSSRRAATLLRTDILVLKDRLDQRLEAEYANLAAFNRRLAIALLVGSLAAILLMTAATAALLGWVLRPIQNLRGQIREVASSTRHDHALVPSGPPEIQAMGRDTEYLRQQLVGEIAKAVAAGEALAQKGPVVAAIHAELDSPSNPLVPGFAVWGEVKWAEGVLAGDWWATAAIPPPRGEHDDGLGQRTGLVVTDISGHGAQAGVAGLRLKYQLIGALEAGVSPEAAFAACTRIFHDNPARFATATALVLSPTGSVGWVNAGQHPPLLLTSTGDAHYLGATGPIMSALGGQWGFELTGMSPGDLLVCYTDGLIESRDDDGNELGPATLLHWCQHLATEGREEPAEMRVERFVSGLISLADQRSEDLRRDDVTVVAVLRTKVPVSGS